jgi:anaerobic selenocysteine-containing dehydrogenase
MIHVLLEEELYGAPFVRAWTNAPLLIREDTQQLLSGRELASVNPPDSFVVWDQTSDHPVSYLPSIGYLPTGAQPALFGTFEVTLSDGQIVTCRPVLDALKELAARFAPERSEAVTWVSAAEVRRAARMFATETPSCYASWAGLEQHADAGQTNRAVSCFYALTGQFDAPGSNVLFANNPINPVLGTEFLPPDQATRRLGLHEHPIGPPADPGFVTADAVYRGILENEPYPVRGLVLFGGDPLVGHADPRRGKAALEALDFYVHVDLVANPSSVFADLLLPASSCWEAEAIRPTFGIGWAYPSADTATWTQLRQAVVPPMGESRSDLVIIFDLAQRLGFGEYFFDGNIEAAFNYQMAPSEVTVAKLRANPVGVGVGVPTRYRKYADVNSTDGHARGFPTPTRKIELYSTRFAQAGYPPLPASDLVSDDSRPDPRSRDDFPLVLTFYRLVQFCDEQHRHIPRLRKQATDPIVEIHPNTAKAAGLAEGDWAVVETPAGRVRLRSRYNQALDPRVVATTYGWWQACQELGLPGYNAFADDGANANLVVASRPADPISASVGHRSQLCRVRKHDNQNSASSFSSTAGAEEQPR